MYKIKIYNITMYRELLGDKGSCWIESGGWYLLSHIPVSWRLHKAIIGRYDPEIISSSFRVKYITFAVAYVVSLMGFVISVIFAIISTS